MHSIHELKTINRYWDAVAAGNKTFEVRRNDRAFQAGDVIVLTRTTENGNYDTRPQDQSTDGSFAKSQISFRITYLLQGGQFGIEPGFCVLGLGPIVAEKDTSQ